MDNKLPNNQNNSQNNTQGNQAPSPVISTPTAPATPATAANVEQSQPPPPAGVPSATVVIPEEKKGKLPFWFYLLFALVSIIFFFITFLLIRTLFERQNSPSQSQVGTLIPTSVPSESLPISTPTPIDEFINSIETQNESDDTAAIEADLEKTSTEDLKTDLDEIDASVNP